VQGLSQAVLQSVSLHCSLAAAPMPSVCCESLWFSPFSTAAAAAAVAAACCCCCCCSLTQLNGVRYCL